jgi:hypothetical protein
MMYCVDDSNADIDNENVMLGLGQGFRIRV